MSIDGRSGSEAAGLARRARPGPVAAEAGEKLATTDVDRASSESFSLLAQRDGAGAELGLANLVAADLDRVDLESQARASGHGEKTRRRRARAGERRSRRRTSVRKARRRWGTCSWPAWPGGCRRPGQVPSSGMEPTQQAMPCWWQRSWMARAGPSPPTRWILRLTIRQAPRRMASAVCSRVSADSSRQTGVVTALLELGQAVEVVRLHRLLEHEQVEVIKRAEHVDIGGRVGPVGVDHEGDLAEVLADGADKLDVAARLDLDFHPAISLGQVGLDGLEQLDDRGIKADGQPRLNAQADLLVDGAEKLGDRRVVGLSQQVPEGVLGAGDREPASLPARGQRRRWTRESRRSGRSGEERSRSRRSSQQPSGVSPE